MQEEAKAAPSRAELGIPEGVPTVMQIGVFREEKNQIEALEAVAGMRAAGSGAHLVYVGDGPVKPEVEARATELGADWVHFLGIRSDIAALLGVADVLVQPSLAEAMPMTVLEAMAVGVPVVATAVGDVPTMLAGRAGEIVNPGDRAGLEAALTALLADPGKRATMGEAGREIASSRDSSKMVDAYETLFEAALGGTAPAVAVAT